MDVLYYRFITTKNWAWILTCSKHNCQISTGTRFKYTCVARFTTRNCHWTNFPINRSCCDKNQNIIAKVGIQNKQMSFTTIFVDQGVSYYHGRGKNKNGKGFYSSHIARTSGRQRVKACEKVIEFTQSSIYRQNADVVYHFA